MMKKTIFLFFSLLSVTQFAFGAIGEVDNREVVGWLGDKPEYVDANTKNNWDTDKYNKIVYLIGKGIKSRWSGTGAFISPKHILTARHVVADDNGDNKKCGLEGKPECEIYMSDGTMVYAKTIAYGPEINMEDKDKKHANDWAVLEVSKEDYCNKNFFDGYIPTYVTDDLWRAGFGGLRKLTDSDIQNMQTAYLEYLKEIETKINNGQPITEKEFVVNKNASISDKVVYVNGAQTSKGFLKKFKELTGSDFVEDYLKDDLTLKAVKCGVKKTDNNDLVWHNCYCWQGDSGSPIIKDLGTQSKVISIDIAGSSFVAAVDYIYDIGVKSQNIFSLDILEKIAWAKLQCDVMPAPSVVVGGNEMPGSGSGSSTTVVTIPPVYDNTPVNNMDSTVFGDIDNFIRNNFSETSKWSNADGSFNTKRLVSDSVSGIVLGSVGGIVTSVVIKNNQTKQGFESLKCTIGGQDVSVYGDEFRVGLQE